MPNPIIDSSFPSVLVYGTLGSIVSIATVCDLDKSQPDLSCGTTGKYAGITGSEPFACNSMPALAGGRGLYRNGHPPQHVLGDQEIKFLP